MFIRSSAEANDLGAWPAAYTSHMDMSARSKLRTHRCVSKSAQVVRASRRRRCRARSFRRSLPSSTARSSYSAIEATTISSANPADSHRLAATREAIFSAGQVTIGTPAHSTSQPVVCALHSGVSRKMSASLERWIWSSLPTTSVKTMRPAGTPRAAASASRRTSPAGGKRSSHSTLLGTRCRMEHHRSNVSGSILYSWLAQ
mmetsp:Transcript_7382/g.22381  ORF Transcript_7382/g.22381 Transcript_7382/m.22381 type:complete len:202 (-) Transcript_7382:2153-2758(-)